MGISQQTAEFIAKGIPIAAGLAFPAVSIMRSSDYERNPVSAVTHGVAAAGVGFGVGTVTKGLVNDYAPEIIAKAIARGVK